MSDWLKFMATRLSGQHNFVIFSIDVQVYIWECRVGRELNTGNSERHLRGKLLKGYGAWKRGRYSPCSQLPLPALPSFLIILCSALNPMPSDCHLHPQSSVDSRHSGMRETKRALWERFSSREVSRFQLDSNKGKGNNERRN